MTIPEDRKEEIVEESVHLSPVKTLRKYLLITVVIMVTLMLVTAGVVAYAYFRLQHQVDNANQLASNLKSVCEAPNPTRTERVKALCKQANAVVNDSPVKVEPGAMGPTGPQGPQGPSGAVGPPGRDGNSGAPGATGAAGARGENGVNGLPGAAGKDGAVGPIGPAGPKGDKGDQGSQGDPGKNGTDGKDGSDGSDGKDAPTVTSVDCSGGLPTEKFTFHFSDGTTQTASC